MKKFLHLILMFAVITLIFASCKDTTTNPVSENIISGIIADELDAPIENALVELLGAEEKVISNTKTNENGEFSFTVSGNDYKNFSLRVSFEGYQTLNYTVSEFLKDNQKPNNMKLKLNKLQEQDDCCGQLTITVKKFETDQVISGAKVKISKENKNFDILTTNDNGKVTWNKLCSGTYWVRISKDNFQVLEKEFIIEGDCDTLSFEYGIKPEENSNCCNNIAKFTINDAEGKGIKGARVLLRISGQVKYEGSANEDGKVVIDGICKGKYSVIIKYEGYVSQEVDLEFNCEQTIEKTVKLDKVAEKCCNNTFKILVKDSKTGNPIKESKVALWQEGKMVYYAYTNQEGYAEINNICQGKYGVSIIREGYTGIEWQVEFECEKVLSFEKSITPKANTDCCGIASFVVKDYNTGLPIKNAEVKVQTGNTYKILKTDENGFVKFTELCIGSYWVRVAYEGYQVMEEDFKIESCEKQVEMTLKIKPKENSDCCNNQIKFVVKDAEGNLLTNVQIKLVKGGSIITTLKTQNGLATTDKNICKGSYGVRIYLEGYDVIEYELNVDCNQVIEQSKVLTKKSICCEAWAKVFVFDNESKQALNGAKVKIWKGGQLLKTLTVENGYVKFTGLCEGEYGFDVVMEGYKSIEFGANIKCNQENIFEKGLIKN